jgi:hypothetical protein
VEREWTNLMVMKLAIPQQKQPTGEMSTQRQSCSAAIYYTSIHYITLQKYTTSVILIDAQRLGWPTIN